MSPEEVEMGSGLTPPLINMMVRMKFKEKRISGQKIKNRKIGIGLNNIRERMRS